MTDRIMRGYVIDMLDFRGIWHFVFNFADVFINVGVGIIILDYLVKKIEKQEGINDFSKYNTYITEILGR